MLRREESGKRVIAGNQTFVLTLLVSAVCWVLGYVCNIGSPLVTNGHATPLWQSICRLITNKETAYLVGLGLMFGGAFLIHRTNYILAFIRQKTVLPFLFFILFISTNPDFFPLKATSVAVFFLVLALYQLFLSYHIPQHRSRAFNWAFLICLGSLFWIHLLWFIPLFWFGMYFLRSLNLRNFFASIFGGISVYWLVLGWCVWQNDFALFSQSFPLLSNFKFLQFSGNQWELLGIAVMALLTLISSLNILLHEYADNLRTREYLSFLIILSIGSFLLYFLYDYAAEEFMAITCIPVSILCGHFFTVSWNKWISYLFYSTIIFFIVLLFIRLWPNL